MRSWSLAEIEDQSLELLVEREAEADDDDEEAALDELIELMAQPEFGSVSFVSGIQDDEFTCRSCHLVLHQGQLADYVRMICRDCAGVVRP